MAPTPHWTPGNIAGPSQSFITFMLPSEHRDTVLYSHTLSGSMEPLRAPSGLSTWVPCIAISTLSSSHLPGLYAGKETWVPSVLRSHIPLKGFCHSSYPLLSSEEEPGRKLTLCQGSTVTTHLLPMLIWSTFSLLEHGRFTHSTCLLSVIFLPMHMYLFIL